jgi:hypothetical protein
MVCYRCRARVSLFRRCCGGGLLIEVLGVTIGLYEPALIRLD